jgi:hypothetical protein
MSNKQIQQLQKKIGKLESRIEATKNKLDGELNVLYHMVVDLSFIISEGQGKAKK